MSPSIRDTGFPASDAQDDFARARRRAVLAKVGARLRGQPTDVGLILPFEEVVEALGRIGQTDLGLQVVPLDAIVKTFRITGLDGVFRLVPTLADALDGDAVGAGG